MLRQLKKSFLQLIPVIGICCASQLNLSCFAHSSDEAKSIFKQACNEALINSKHHLALRDFDLAIKLDPNNSMFYTKKGELLSHLQEDELAIETAKKAISLDQKNSRAWFVQGKSLGRMGRTEEGLQSLNKALKLDSNDADIWSARGRLYSVLGRWNQAEADMTKAIQLTKINNAALMDRITAREHLNKWPEVIADCSAALALNSSNRGRILRSRAGAYVALKDYARATSDLRDALKIWPDDIRIHQQLTAVYKMTGDRKGEMAESKIIQGLSKDF
ncbi:MAG: tetratricopeptide repeat protein [Vicinamibacterales bacterium]|jgi:tetratricopeptide (TPR) repeat protein